MGKYLQQSRGDLRSHRGFGDAEDFTGLAMRAWCCRCAIIGVMWWGRYKARVVPRAAAGQAHNGDQLRPNTGEPWSCLLYSVAQWSGILYAVCMASLLVRFGRAVRRSRERTQYSQERFANAIGVHRSYMWSIERGRANPSLDVIARIARGLGVPISKLFEAAEREG